MLLNLLLIIAAYLFGSISTAILVCRVMGLPDPRAEGSNNPGATNVLRIGGKLPAALTLAGDMLKGLIPAALSTALSDSSSTLALVCLAAFAGHLFPVFFRFRGGKGVATALGACLGAAPVTGVLALVTWLVISLISRISSVAALGTFLLVPVYLLIQGQSTLAFGFAVIGLLLFYTHRANLSRLANGTEPKIGSRSGS